MIPGTWTREELVDRIAFWEKRISDLEQSEGDPKKKGKIWLSKKTLAKRRLQLEQLNCQS